MENKVDFNYDMTKIIRMRCKKEVKLKDEPLDAPVMAEIFSLSNKKIEAFKTELFMPITDYSYFQQEKKRMREVDPN